METTKRRFVGIDLGKKTWVMTIITRTGRMVKNERGGEERYEYMTAGPNGKKKKKAIVASNRRFAARRLGELLYTLLKKGEDYEVRHFKRPADKKQETEALVQSAISA
jgi:hypothetical protein